MESAGYFDPTKCQWHYKDKVHNNLRHAIMYDGGVDRSTVYRCEKAGFRCVKTGTKRTDGKSTLSNVARSMGQEKSVLRIRVENKIGDSKNTCKLIAGGRSLSIHYLAIVHKIVFVCYVLMNFNSPTIV